MRRRDVLLSAAAGLAPGLNCWRVEAKSDDRSERLIELPELDVIDQDGVRYRFKRDLVGQYPIILQFFFAGCRVTCDPSTAILQQAKKLVEDKRLAVRIISLTVAPLADSPKELKAYAQRFNIATGLGRGWIMGNTAQADLARLLRALGPFSSRAGEEHPDVLWVRASGDRGWINVPTLSAPSAIAAKFAP